MKRLLAFLLLFAIAYGVVLDVPAVTRDNKGVKVKLECELIKGSGRVLVATEPFVGISTQQSERNAVKAVENLLGVNLTKNDVIFIFHTNTSKSVDGGSAGVAMAICLIGELLNKTPNPYVSVTGAINENGDVLPVGGILQKVQAMHDKSVFLIPSGQSITYTYTKRYYSPSPGVYVEEVYPVKVNITEYALKQWNLKVVEIKHLKDAVKWFFNESVGKKKEIMVKELPAFDTDLERIEKLADYEIERAKELVSKSNSTIAQEMLTKALQTPKGYPYTRANFAFLASVYAERDVSDISMLAQKLEEEFKKTPTSDPYWRAEAELRLSWALFNTENFAARKEWLIIAAKMFAMEKFGDKVINAKFVKEKADKMIIEAKKEVENAKIMGINTEKAENSLNMALKSYEEELYFAALYNAIDAIAWAKAGIGGSFNISKKYEHEFPEAYRRHAIYLLHEGNREGAAYSAIRAELREKAFEKSQLLPIGFTFPKLNWRDVLIVLLALYIIAREVKREKKSELNDKELGVLLEVKAEAVKALRRKFEKGEIKQDEYYRILKQLEGL